MQLVDTNILIKLMRLQPAASVLLWLQSPQQLGPG
jgi:predicted nucleic acid-binding protein